MIVINKQRRNLQKQVFFPLLLTVWLLAFTFFGCGLDVSSENNDVVIQVNNSKISLEEFNEMIQSEVYSDPELDLTNESRDQFINYLVRKELMIQEAVRLKLDRKKNFIRTIEKYWESTLIRNLLDLKSEEMKKKVLITDDELKQYYADHKTTFNQSFAEAKNPIRSILESRKLETRMEEWTTGLRESADIKINRKRIVQ